VKGTAEEQVRCPNTGLSIHTSDALTCAQRFKDASAAAKSAHHKVSSSTDYAAAVI
jgi:hypothetical protein